ncbi:MAG: hypothetical protein WC966_10385 [Bradymonadales bacterium]
MMAIVKMVFATAPRAGAVTIVRRPFAIPLAIMREATAQRQIPALATMAGRANYAIPRFVILLAQTTLAAQRRIPALATRAGAVTIVRRPFAIPLAKTKVLAQCSILAAALVAGKASDARLRFARKHAKTAGAVPRQIPVHAQTTKFGLGRAAK